MVPGAELIDIANDAVWRDAGAASSAIFSISEQYPVVGSEVYVFLVRSWYSPTQFSIFTSEGVVIDVRGPLIIRGSRVREGNVAPGFPRNITCKMGWSVFPSAVMKFLEP